MLSNELRAFQPGELSRHPWQDNVPDMGGQEWQDFLADVRARGMQEPIRVSNRLGYPVIVDGHQRHRAALELELPEVQAFVQPFESEAQEVEFLASAARLRRHLTDFQRVTLARAYEAYFRPMAVERKGGRPKAGQKPAQDSGQVSTGRHERSVDAQAAAVAGIGRETFRQGKIIQEKAPEPVKQAWAREEISTNAAHELTRAPDPIGEAIEREDITVHQGLRVLKDKGLKADVEAGRKTVQEAVSLADMLKEQREREEAEMGTKAAHAMQSILDRIRDLTTEEYLEVLNSRHNSEKWGGSFSSDWQEAIRHMRAIAQAVEGQIATKQARTIDAEGLN